MAQRLVLIVDDNPKNLKLVRDILQFKGYATIEASTAESAVRLAQQQLPALVLMDVQLPDMDGRVALESLKSDARTRHIPVIALTAMAMKGARESLLAEGFDAYLPKPIDLQQFLKTVETYVG